MVLEETNKTNWGQGRQGDSHFRTDRASPGFTISLITPISEIESSGWPLPARSKTRSGYGLGVSVVRTDLIHFVKYNISYIAFISGVIVGNGNRTLRLGLDWSTGVRIGGGGCPPEFDLEPWAKLLQMIWHPFVLAPDGLTQAIWQLQPCLQHTYL